MSVEHRLSRLLARLDQALEQSGDQSDWIERANRQNLQALRDEVSLGLLTSLPRVRLRFSQGVVLGSSGPAYLLLRAAFQFNDAVVSAANTKLHRPYTSIDDRARSRLGLLALPAIAGSYALEFACPPAQAARSTPDPGHGEQDTLVSSYESGSVTAVGLANVIDVLTSVVRDEMASQGLEQKLSAVGTHGIRSLARFSARLAEGDLRTDISTAAPSESYRALVLFRARDAAYLHETIKNRALDESRREVRGQLLTASSVRSVFDILTDEGSKVSGTVAPEAQQGVVELFTRRVVAQVVERLDPADPTGDRIRRELVEIRQDPGAPHQGEFDVQLRDDESTSTRHD